MTAHTKASPEDIYEYIVVFVNEHGFSPTTREIAEGVGLSSQSAVQRSINKLREEGAITLVPGMSRTVRPARNK